jgi:hypothetical protein
LLAQSPQVPPQPSSPQATPSQKGVHSQTPATHWSLPTQSPQEPPQPSSPQTRPVQSGVQQVPLSWW